MEPFYGGSHKDFASGLIKHSRHQIDLVTLPARFWKWRMRGAALYFHEKIRDFSQYDGIITSDMINLTDLIALGGSSMPACLVYFHENQLTYPLASGEKIDYQFGFTNITTALAASQLLFNSQTHLQAFITAVSDLMQKLPDARIKWTSKSIEAKAGVIYPGCSFPAGRSELEAVGALPPLIIWNHRWEFDKQPDVFLQTLKMIKQKGIPFRLALLGESCQSVPKVFKKVCSCFKEEVVVSGYVKSRRDYEGWLKKGAIVVSTAIQENFGISVVEAVRFGALPLLPDRLSYPEIIPRAFHGDFIYSSFEELVMKLGNMLENYGEFQGVRQDLSHEMERYAWENMIGDYDCLLDELGG